MPGVTSGNTIASSAQINAGVILGSDLANDTVEAAQIATDGVDTAEIKDGVIVNADISASAAIVDTKLATIATAGKVNGAAITSLASIPAGAGVIPAANIPGGSVLAIIPRPMLPHSGAGTQGNNNNTVGRVHMFNLVRGITVNKITFNVTAVGTAGTLKIAIYSEDGQTKVLEIETTSISTTGKQSFDVSAVVLAPGNYYFMVLPVSTAAITLSTWASSTTINVLNQPSSEPSFAGDYTCTASTIPATMDLSLLSSDVERLVAFRLDN